MQKTKQHPSSLFSFYSVGIVAVNKLMSEHYVEIIPIENSPFMDGELTDRFEEYEAEGKNFYDENFDHKIDTTLSVRAKWLPLCNGNQITAPDVRRGEHVMLYKFGDSDEFWWTTLRQDKHIRRLETVIYSFSNNRDEDIEDDPETTYWMEVSTHKKIIHLHTSKNDDEPFTYDIQINTKDGRIVIQDDDNNYVFIDSAQRHIKLHNKDTSYVELDKRVINIHSLDEINLTTDRYTLKAKTSITTQTKTHKDSNDDYTMKASKTITTETKEQKTTNENHTENTTKGLTLDVGDVYKVKSGKSILFQTPRYEYKVDAIKFKVSQDFHAEVTKGKFRFKADIDHEGIITTELVPGPAIVPSVDIITN